MAPYGDGVYGEDPPPTGGAGWLPLEQLRRWLNVSAADPADVLAAVDDCRVAAKDYCEAQRPDLRDAAGVFTPTHRVVQAGVQLAARLYARRGSPAGIAAYSELGPVTILRFDPDIAQLLGVGRYAPPRVG